MTLILTHNQISTVAAVPITDRCFNYGDGCFTTIRLQDHQLQLLDRHLERLQKACKVLLIATIDWSQLEHCLRSLAAKESGTFVIKVLISRGAGGRGYSAGLVEPVIYVTRSNYPSFYIQWRQQGITLGVSPVRLGLNPLLAQIKHCNRLEQVLVKKAMENQSFDDVVVCDLTGSVVECSASNLFWLINGQWHTPRIQQAGVEGVMKQFIINHVIGFAETQQVEQPIEHLAQASSVFVCNALMGCVAVNSLTVADHIYHYDNQAVISLSAQLEQLLGAQRC